MRFFQDSPYLFLSNHKVYVIEESDNQKNIVEKLIKDILIIQDHVEVSCGLHEYYLIGEGAFVTREDAIAYILLQNSKNPLVKSMLMLYRTNDGLEGTIEFLAREHSWSCFNRELDDICYYELLDIPDNNIYQFRNILTGQRFDVYLPSAEDGKCDTSKAMFSYVDNNLTRHNVKRASEAISKYWSE